MFVKKSENKNTFSRQSISFLLKTDRLIFRASGLTFVVYFFFEQFKTGLISNYFDLNLLLVLLVISGFVNFIFNDKISDNLPEKKQNRWHYVIYLIFAILIGVLIYQQLDILGSVSVIIVIFSILSLFSIFILTLSGKR